VTSPLHGVAAPSSVAAVTEMKDLVRFRRSRIRYTGRVDRSAFLAWCGSDVARATLASIAERIRFAPLGRMRAARRRLWNEVATAARSAVVVNSCQSETENYLARLEIIVHAVGLPCVHVALHRLIVVPRLLANAAIDRRLDLTLATEPAFATINGRAGVREWFISEVIGSVEWAIQQERPSLKAPLRAADEWAVVGVDDRFEWRPAISGVRWPGHYYLFERTLQPITRAVLKAASVATATLEPSLSSLSRLQRDEILRRAGRSAEQLLAQHPLEGRL
jgi:hypothetical protein